MKFLIVVALSCFVAADECPGCEGRAVFPPNSRHPRYCLNFKRKFANFDCNKQKDMDKILTFIMDTFKDDAECIFFKRIERHVETRCRTTGMNKGKAYTKFMKWTPWRI